MHAPSNQSTAESIAASAAAALCMLAGVWLATAPFALDYANEGAIWSDLAIGLVVALTSAVALSARGNPPGPALIATGVGMWLLLSTLGLGLADTTVLNRAICGAVLTGAGAIRILP